MKIIKYLLLQFLCLFFVSCNKEYADPTPKTNEDDTLTPYLPKVKTLPVNTISYFDALSGGEILSMGEDSVIQKGVCWSKTSDVSLKSSKTVDGKGMTSYVSKIVDLEYGTTYYVRAYATNFYGTSYGNMITFSTNNPLFTSGNGVKDVEGNSYESIIIGNQEWMSENLRTTKLNDGTSIPYVYDNSTWNYTKSPGYCVYNNDNSNINNFGMLYNGYTVETNKLCPTGWHVPIQEDWQKLSAFLGGDDVAGGKLKIRSKTLWTTPNTEATNISGFSAVGGGLRTTTGLFVNKFIDATFWTNEENIIVPYHQLHFRYIKHATGNFYPSSSYNELGASVRCIKD
jgi:uncharacterized protein (TIGR02145 family)